MKPVDPKIIDALRLSGLALGGLVAAMAIYQYLRVTGRPDATEMRDLGLLVALELAAIPAALSFLMPRRDGDITLALAPTPAPRLPNPWSF